MSTINLNTPCILSLREEKKKTCEGKFEEILQGSVDEIFSSFGRSCKQAIYFQLEKEFNIKKQEFSLKTADFANAIEKIFGPSAKFIELRIIEKLHEKTPNFMYSPDKKNLVFTEYVVNLRQFFKALAYY